MTAYERDPATEPIHITTMRRLRKQHRTGQTTADELGEPLLNDLFRNTTPPTYGIPTPHTSTRRTP